jgi:hypothetical protein
MAGRFSVAARMAPSPRWSASGVAFAAALAVIDDGR